MPVLDARALKKDPKGAAFLKEILRLHRLAKVAARQEALPRRSRLKHAAPCSDPSLDPPDRLALGSRR